MRDLLLACVLQILNHGPRAVVCHRYQPAVTAAYAIQEAHREYPSVPPKIIAAVMATESGFDVRALGSRGELGLMQIMRGGALEGNLRTLPEPVLYNPRVNVLLGARYLSMMQRRCGGQAHRYLSCYNGRRGKSSYSVKVLGYLRRAK